MGYNNPKREARRYPWTDRDYRVAEAMLNRDCDWEEIIQALGHLCRSDAIKCIQHVAATYMMRRERELEAERREFERKLRTQVTITHDIFLQRTLREKYRPLNEKEVFSDGRISRNHCDLNDCNDGQRRP